MNTHGTGAPELDLSPDEQTAVVRAAMADLPSGSRVLAIIPDKSRDDNTDVLFPAAARALRDRQVARFDALVAQGTHGPMTDAEKRRKIGADRADVPGLGKVIDHRWDDADHLTTLGTLTAERVADLTGGLLRQDLALRINRLLGPGHYDVVLIFGATVPHEVAGFAGGAKYFFPGVAGPDLTHATHWLAALAGVEETIGRVETPVRHVIEAAADHVPARVISLNTVVTRPSDDRLRVHALFAGDFRTAFRQACAVSRIVHVRYTGRKYRRVVALLDPHYEDLWVGGKASYRLGGVIEAGGELLIVAPHLHGISDTHGKLIEKYGYAPLETVRDWVAREPELRANLCVAAHLTHVAYAGRRDGAGNVVPRFGITLCSPVSADTCRRVNLGHLDPARFRRADYEGDADTLIVERAGRDLYLPDAA